MHSGVKLDQANGSGRTQEGARPRTSAAGALFLPSFPAPRLRSPSSNLSTRCQRSPYNPTRKTAARLEFPRASFEGSAKSNATPRWPSALRLKSATQHVSLRKPRRDSRMSLGRSEMRRPWRGGGAGRRGQCRFRIGFRTRAREVTGLRRLVEGVAGRRSRRSRVARRHRSQSRSLRRGTQRSLESV
mgnify:CR=1 FL=1